MLGQVALESLNGALGLPLLGEGEEGVQHDHCDDRDGEDRQFPEEGENSGEPQQEREWVRELPEEVVPPAAPSPSPELVRAEFDEPPRRLTRRKPGWGGVEIPEEHLGGLLGIAVPERRHGWVERGHLLRRSRVRARAASGPGTRGRAAFPQASGGLPTDGAGRARAGCSRRDR